MDSGFVLPILLSLLAGLSTVIGSLIAFFVKEIEERHISMIMGFSAGIMIFISFVEFLSTSIDVVGFFWSNLMFFVGIVIMYLIDTSIPHIYKSEKSEKGIEGFKGLRKTSLMIALGIGIHNFPEGIAVLFSSLSSLRLGVLVALTIALHNIPEGICVSIPIYKATRSRKKALKYSFLSGIAEPVGAILAALFFAPFITDFLLYAMFAFVAGIMVYISFDELLPTCFRCRYYQHSILGLFIGMLVMSFGIFISL